MSQLKVVLFVASVWAGARGASLLTTDTLTAPQVFSMDPPWLAVFSCFRTDSPSVCFQTRAVRALEDMLPQDDDKSTELEEKLPKGMSPTVGRLIDRIGDLIASGLSQWYPETDSGDVESADSVNNVEEARGHKKKVKKAIKKAILKLIIVGLLIKQKIKMLLMAAQTFLQFKFLLVATVYVVSNIVKIWLDIKSKHHPQKVIYYENAHHQHHYEPEHHDFEEHDHGGGGGGWGGLWGRSIVATEATPTINPYHSQQHQPHQSHDNHYENYPRSIDSAQELAYHAHKPQAI